MPAKLTVTCLIHSIDERDSNNYIIRETRKNSNIMITGELILINSEFQVDIQDLNFLPMSISNIEPIESSSTSSLYS